MCSFRGGGVQVERTSVVLKKCRQLVMAHKCIRRYVHGWTYIHVHKQICTNKHTIAHTYIHTNIHTYIYTYINTYIHAKMHACKHAYIHAYIYANVQQAYIYNRNTHTHVLFFPYTHTCIRAYMIGPGSR